MKVRHFSQILVLLLLSGWLFCGYAFSSNLITEPSTAPQVSVDQSRNVVVRSPSEQTLNNFRNNKEFNYHQKEVSPPSIFGLILEWLFKMLRKLFGNRYSSYSSFLIYLTLGLVFIYLILKIIQSRPENLFYTNKNQRIDPYDGIIEDLHTIDFDAKIKNAAGRHDYRAAIRWQYLKSLSYLSSRGLIHWKSDKTNDDYLHELQEQSILSSFREITKLFEYSWYGNFLVSESFYMRSRTLFLEFNKQLGEGK